MYVMKGICISILVADIIFKTVRFFLIVHSEGKKRLPYVAFILLLFIIFFI